MHEDIVKTDVKTRYSDRTGIVSVKPSKTVKNILTIDVEEWYHFIGDPGAPLYPDWRSYESRVELFTHQILEIVDGLSVTFFILGFIAEHHPQLVKRISAGGHEIACHGYRHDFVFNLSPKTFREDISSSKKLLEDLTGKPCIGYRAPAFSIRKENLWALRIVKEEGFLYDASIFPGIRTDGGGGLGFNRFPHELPLDGTHRETIREFPISTARVLGFNIGFCGGGFFRFFPETYIHKNIKKINRHGQPAVVYLHPRDIDPFQPRLKLKPVNQFLYYHGLNRAREKFVRLVKAFDWIGMGKYGRFI